MKKRLYNKISSYIEKSKKVNIINISRKKKMNKLKKAIR